MKALLKKYPEYKIIEAHNGALGVYALYAARKNDIPVRIFHAHGAGITKDWKWPIKIFCKTRLKINTRYNFTCGIVAAEYYYGKDVVEKGKYELIPNAIEVERFVFNPEIRNKIRKQYNIEKKHVVGHVGRFVIEKNHDFLIDVFNNISKKDEEAVLVLIGEGELQEKIKQKVLKLGLKDKVIFVGNTSSVNEWYSVFDVFVLPSKREGLPVVGVEAQAADLQCIFSDHVTKEIKLSKRVEFLAVNKNEDEWAKVIISKFSVGNREDKTQEITVQNYNIHVEAIKLQARYLQLYGEYES